MHHCIQKITLKLYEKKMNGTRSFGLSFWFCGWAPQTFPNSAPHIRPCVMWVFGPNSSLQPDSNIKFAAWPTSLRLPGADRL